MIKEIIFVMILTLLPFLELRYAIPAGIILGRISLPFGLSLVGFGLPWYVVLPAAVATNILLGILIYFLLDKVVHWFFFIKPFEKFYHKTVERYQRKIRRYVDRYGEAGLAVFISIPLPGSGVYSGALCAYALGLSFRKFVIAEAIGVTIAGIIVTSITLGVISI